MAFAETETQKYQKLQNFTPHLGFIHPVKPNVYYWETHLLKLISHFHQASVMVT